MLLTTTSLLLADDVGLGKTVSTICTFMDPRTLPALVVTMTHLPTQWEAEIKRFAPHLTTHIIKQGTPYDLTRPRGRGKNRQKQTFPDVIIINYHKLVGWAETLAPFINSMALDECQELRTGPGTAKYRAAQHLADNVEFRLGLSATPIYNYGGEFYHVLEVIRPGALGDYDEFHREWTTGGFKQLRVKDPKAFGSYLRDQGLMLRRTCKEVGRELPPLTKIPQRVDADLSALDQVSDSCAELARLILSQGEQRRGEKMMASEQLSNQLRQATGIAKAPYVAEFVRLLLESGEKVVLYGWHRECYSIWMDRLKDFRPALYTGTESATQKDAAKNRFLSDDKINGTDLLIMSLRSGAGLDGLQTKCHIVVLGELDWSPAVIGQNIGRVARDGQENPVFAYFPIADSGSDPIMADVLGIKRQQLEGVINPDIELLQKLQVDPGHMRRLAEAFLAQRGIAPPAAHEGV